MKKRSLFRVITRIALASGVLVAAAGTFPGCAREEAFGPGIAHLPGMDRAGTDSSSQPHWVESHTSFALIGKGACERFDALAAMPVGERTFSYLSELELDPAKPDEAQGALALEDSPFVQFVLGEQFAFDSPEAFLKKARAEYEAGRLGGLEWNALRLASAFPAAFKLLQVKATNAKLEEAFPGIFGGKSHGLAGSLSWKLLGRAAESPSRRSYERLLKRLPLFLEGDWRTVSADFRESLEAALESHGRRDEDGVCALLLWQRAFAQLLSLKGYWRPASGDRVSRISFSHPGFDKKVLPGVFSSAMTGEPVALSQDMIQSYNPSRRTLRVGTGTLTEQLTLLEGLVYAYEATSPAGPWLKEPGDYPLGDIQANGTRAILPFETHALSLGLLGMSFKNLAAFHIQKVDGKGRALKPGQPAAGIVLTEAAQTGSGGIVSLSVEDVMALTRIVVALETSLSQFKLRPASEWAKTHPLYEPKLLASLLGTELFSESELGALLKPEERGSILKASLVQLRLPLASLLARMRLDGEGCASTINWNLATGDRSLGAPCSRALSSEYRQVERLLGNHVRARLLMR